MAALGNTQFYKQFAQSRTAFYLLIFMLCVVFVPSARAQANPAYTVEGVEIDVTAENAVKAREKAMAEAQVKAYQMLAERFLSPEELKSFHAPDADTVSMLVQDFEVTNEQLSAVRYKGTFTVRFRPNAMKTQMASQGKVYSDIQQKPVLILPFYEAGGKTSLWNQGNPWMQAWRALPADKNALQPLAIPLGDAQDAAQISDEQAMDYDPVMLQQLAERYNADDIAILLASAEQKGLTVNMYHNGFDGPVFIQKIVIDKTSGETDQAFFNRAALQAKALLRQNWKANAAYNPAMPGAQPSQQAAQTTYTGDAGTMYQMMRNGQVPQAQGVPPPAAHNNQGLGTPTTYPAIARFNSVQDWVRMKNTLDRVYGVQFVLIKSLKTREAYIDIRYAGEIRALQAALQTAGIGMRSSFAGAPIELFVTSSNQPIYR